jgi:CheY-like chemotaxis protein
MTRMSKSVLIVEDDDDSREVSGELIALFGSQPALAKDAVEALQIVDLQQLDIAIIDLTLPGMGGCQLARLLRERIGSRLRLIALTGHTDSSVRKEAAAAGFDDYWLKPVGAEAFAALFPTVPELVQA